MENNKQQTAVEWLVEQLRQLAFNPKTHIGMGDIRVTQGHLDELSEQAKEMEKQQIISAWIVTDNQLQRIAAEKYYNETYGKQEIEKM